MPASVTTTTTDGQPTLLLTAPGGALEATFAPGAGMVCCGLRHEGDELLGQRGGLAMYMAQGSTFGIPLLFPWANRIAGLRYRVAGREVVLDPDASPVRVDPAGLPIHGLLAACPDWQVTDATGHGDAAVLRASLDFAAQPALMAAFPFAHVITMDVRLDDTALTITTTVTPAGDTPVPIAFGFHPYLALPGGTRDGVAVTLPVEHHALLGADGLPTGIGEPVHPVTIDLDDLAFDDLYDRLMPSPRFVLHGPRRDVSVLFGEGYPVAQIYAPPGEPFICFEPMTAPTNALVSGDRLPMVRPGDAFAATFSVCVGQAVRAA